MKEGLSFCDVKVRVEAPQFWTYHWIMEVPQQLYRQVLSRYEGDIYSEEPVQEFVTAYLRWKGDGGIVGLVGLEVQEGRVLIDAAVRYPAGVAGNRGDLSEGKGKIDPVKN